MKKYLIVVTIIILIAIIGLYFLSDKGAIEKEKIDSDFKGPTGTPFIKGPSQPPPLE